MKVRKRATIFISDYDRDRTHRKGIRKGGTTQGYSFGTIRSMLDEVECPKCANKMTLRRLVVHSKTCVNKGIL